MNRFLLVIAFCCAVALTPTQAQDGSAVDAHAAAMERMERVMGMHEHFMSDSLYRAHMMADTSMQAAMREMRGPEMEAMHEKMAMMGEDARMERMGEMHGHMMERAEAMSPEELAAFHARMMEAHDRAMADPELHERMMADPEMREMMEHMHEDGMMHDDMMEKHEEMMEHHDDMMEKREEMDDDTDG